MATVEVGNLTNTRTFNEFVGNAEPEDYYRFNLSDVGDFRLSLSGLSQTAYAELYLDSDNNGLADSNEYITGDYGSSGSTASITRSLGTGTYFVKVKNSGGSDTRYTLNLSNTSTGIGDPAGNTSQNALNIGTLSGTRTFNDFVGRSDQNDYYRFNLNSVADFNLTLNGLSQTAYAELYLDKNNDGLADSNEYITGDYGSSGSTASINRSLGAGTYFVKVKNSGGSDTKYTLALSNPTSSPTPSPTPSPRGGIITDSNLLSTFNSISAAASTGAANNQFRLLTAQNDTIDLPENTPSQFPGGVLALDGNDDVTGSSGNDVVNGNAGADTVLGEGGNDLLRGGTGNDQISGDQGNDILNGGRGNDSLYGNLGDDFLRGGRDNDLLIGGDGNDILVGDIGSDTLTGGSGADTFVLIANSEAGQRNFILADQITDFGQGDQIAIVGNISQSELRFIASGSNTLIQLGNGDILANVLNISSGAVQSATFIVPATDSALSFG
jgi:Ca2+-binding RTX toxin-like protein